MWGTSNCSARVADIKSANEPVSISACAGRPFTSTTTTTGFRIIRLKSQVVDKFLCSAGYVPDGTCIPLISVTTSPPKGPVSHMTLGVSLRCCTFIAFSARQIRPVVMSSIPGHCGSKSSLRGGLFMVISSSLFVWATRFLYQPIRSNGSCIKRYEGTLTLNSKALSIIRYSHLSSHRSWWSWNDTFALIHTSRDFQSLVTFCTH